MTQIIMFVNIRCASSDLTFQATLLCGIDTVYLVGSFQALVTTFFNISTKSHIRIKFSNADFVFNGELNQK